MYPRIGSEYSDLCGLYYSDLTGSDYNDASGSNIAVYSTK